MLSLSQKHHAQAVDANANAPAGGIPCSRATRKSSSNFCCSPPA